MFDDINCAADTPRLPPNYLHSTPTQNKNAQKKSPFYQAVNNKNPEAVDDKPNNGDKKKTEDLEDENESDDVYIKSQGS